MTRSDNNNDRRAPLAFEAFAALGQGQVAYIKPMQADEVARLYPNAPEMEPGTALWALHAANGEPILIADSLEAIEANALEHDLRTVALH